MEPGNAVVEDGNFSNVTSTSVPKPAGFDAIGTNTKVSRLNGDINIAGNKRTGPAIILKVMAGDIVSVSTQAWYSGTVQPAATSGTAIATELINALTGGIINIGGGKGGINTTAYINSLSTTAVNNLIASQPNGAGQPKAFLNWMVLDEQFALTNTSAYRGAVQVPLISGTMQKQLVPGPVNMVVQKSGYLYVYVSNESNMNVYFDDVVVNHKSGPVLEVTNYRAFGLTMSGISSKAAGKLDNKKGFNGNELQTKEFSDGSGLELYDFDARTYDQQLGRFIQIDPLLEEDGQESISPYHFSYNNPIRFNDPDGEAPDDIVIRGENNSSVTIKTDLIDIDVNASSLGVDFGGTYTLQGDDILGAALDIVGIFDPTGIADGIAAKLSADKGDWGGAIISGLGIFPYVGDIAKVGKVGKDVKIIKNAVENISNGRKQVTKVLPTRKAALDARPKPKPAKAGEKQVTRQSRNKSGEGKKFKTDGGSQTPHVHDKNHNNKKKPNVHYRVGKKKIKP